MKPQYRIASCVIFSVMAISLARAALAQDGQKESPEDAWARIQRMEKIADHALVPPTLNTSPLRAAAYPLRTTCRLPSASRHVA